MTLREDLKNPTMKDAMEDNLALAASQWVNGAEAGRGDHAGAYTVRPRRGRVSSTSAARGGKIFSTGGCIQCHQNFGRESNLVYDAWGTIVRGRNLYDGIYRGGRRPIDLYYRVHGGIEGAGMTGLQGPQGQL